MFEASFGQVTLIRQVYASGFLIFAIGLTYVPALRTSMNEIMALGAVGYAAFFAFNLPLLQQATERKAAK